MRLLRFLALACLSYVYVLGFYILQYGTLVYGISKNLGIDSSDVSNAYTSYGIAYLWDM